MSTTQAQRRPTFEVEAAVFENAAFLFELSNKASEDATEWIAQLKQLVDRLTVAVDIHQEALTWLSEKGLKNEEWLRC